MYLHIGNNRTVLKENIVAIFDCDTSTISPKTKEFLKNKEKNKQLDSEIDDIPKSIIVMNDGAVYMSTLASSVLQSRINSYI